MESCFIIGGGRHYGNLMTAVLDGRTRSGSAFVLRRYIFIFEPFPTTLLISYLSMPHK